MQKENSSDNNSTRTFICIDLPDEIIKEVARLQSIIEKNLKFTGKITELENLHLTLKFLGEINSEVLDKIKSRLSKIKFPALNLKLAEAGTFSYSGNPKIIWLKIQGKDIFNLQKQIDIALENFFSKEERFMSHLTIARIKYVKDKSFFITYIKNIKPKSIKFQVNEIKLKSSELQPQGPIYTTIEEFKAEE